MGPRASDGTNDKGRAMRIKRHKAVRKTLKFFQVNFGFRQPYKILVDGNFIHAVLTTGNGDVESTLSKLLMGSVRAFTTRYTLHELQSLGSEYKATLAAARRLERHKCSFDGKVDTASECMKSEIGTRNESHFFVATQDKDLQKYLSKVSVVPIIFKGVNGVSLLKPALTLKNSVNKASMARMGVQQYEKETAVMKELVDERYGQRQIAKRKKKAKGPNPLSVKKKTVKGAAHRPSGGGEDGSHMKPKRKRMRGKTRRMNE